MTSSSQPFERWLDVLIEASPTPIGIISLVENRYVRANAAMAALYGMSVEEILSANPFSMAFSITHPDELVAEQKLFAELVAGARQSYRIEKRFVRPDGSVRWGVITLSGIFGPPATPDARVGVLNYAVIQVIDVTDQKLQTETLRRRDEELRHAQKIDGIGRLAAGVAHDFNNLLTVIIGHGEVLKQLIGRAGAAPVRDLQANLEAIFAASERAASLTAQLLAYGRRERVSRRTLVLSDTVERLQRLLGRTLGSNVEVEPALTATGSIFADEGQIGQVVMNLMLNARDALPEEGGRIQLATQDVAAGAAAADGVPAGPGEWVALVVSDTGHGMSAEVQARMFEPFFTTRAERPGTQGTGLGLATVQRIVSEAGGHVHVRSSEGQGTRVTALFPRVAAAPKEATRSDVPRASPAPNSRRILVIEDEPSVRSLIGTVLLGAHYWVMVARNGEEALQFIEAEHEPFHLVVTDLVMPRVGGVSLAKHLQERGRLPPMLFVSGYSDDTPAELAAYGSFLPKPFTPSQLLAAVSRALNVSDGEQPQRL